MFDWYDHSTGKSIKTTCPNRSYVKAEGIVKGTALGVADWFTGKSKRRAKKAEENEAKTKAEASAQIKAIRDKCAAKENWRRTR